MDRECYLPPYSCLVIMQVGTGEYMEEVWKDIPGFEGSYQASTPGKIRSYPNKSHNDFYLKNPIIGLTDTKKFNLRCDKTSCD